MPRKGLFFWNIPMSILDPKALQAKVEQQTKEKAVLKDIEFIENGVPVKGKIYVKKLGFLEVEEIDNSYTWEIDPDEEGMMRVKSIDHQRMRAAQIFGSICVDEDGKLFFESVEQVLKAYPAMCKAMWSVSNEHNVFVGKLTTTTSKDTNSGQNLQSTESAVVPSKPARKRSQTGNSNTGEITSKDEEA